MFKSGRAGPDLQGNHIFLAKKNLGYDPYTSWSMLNPNLHDFHLWVVKRDFTIVTVRCNCFDLSFLDRKWQTVLLDSTFIKSLGIPQIGRLASKSWSHTAKKSPIPVSAMLKTIVTSSIHGDQSSMNRISSLWECN